MGFHRAHQLVGIACSHRVHVFADLGKTAQANLVFAGDLGRLQIVVHQTAGFVLNLERREPALALQRRQDARTLCCLRRCVWVHLTHLSTVGGCVLAAQLAIHKRTQHVVVRHAGAVARRIQPLDRGFTARIDVDARSAVPTAKTDFRDVHLHHLLAVVVAPAFVKTTPARALVAVQNGLDFLNRFLRQVVEFQEHRTVATEQFVVELLHHLAAPVVAFDETFALGVGGVPAQWSRHIGTGRAVVVFDQGVDLETLQVGQIGSRVIRHGMAVAAVGGVLVSAHQIT